MFFVFSFVAESAPQSPVQRVPGRAGRRRPNRPGTGGRDEPDAGPAGLPGGASQRESGLSGAVRLPDAAAGRNAGGGQHTPLRGGRSRTGKIRGYRNKYSVKFNYPPCLNQSINQMIHQSINVSINDSINQSINQLPV